MNYNLKAALVQRFGSQVAASRALGITEWKLSRLIRGWDAPSEDELSTFARVLGDRETQNIFAEKAS